MCDQVSENLLANRATSDEVVDEESVLRPCKLLVETDSIQL